MKFKRTEVKLGLLKNTLGCHSRVRGNPLKRLIFMDSRFRGSDREGDFNHFFNSSKLLMRLSGLALLTTFLLVSLNAQAEDFDPVKQVPVELLAAAEGLPAGGSVALAVIFRVPPGYHINSLEGELFYVEFESVPGLAFAPAEFPKGTEFQGELVFPGEVVVRSRVSAKPGLSAGLVTIKAKAGYQICTETGVFQCYFPVEKALALDLPILSADAIPKPRNEKYFGLKSSPVTEKHPTAPVSEISVEQKSPEKSQPVLTKPTEPETATTAIIPEKNEALAKPTSTSTGLVGSLETALAKGSFLALFIVFIGGIFASFTPCVYPIIPITISYIGARAAGKKYRGFFLSLFFVLGLAIMYSSLGIFAALSGGVFGGLTQNPIVYAILIVIFLVMGISMMGAFDLQLPASWQGKLQSGRRKGLVGAVVMGMVSGLIAAPCVGPILVALLTWVAKTGSVLVGFGLLFSFSLGMGLLFIVIGTFAGAITALPKAGGWMDGIKHFFGWLLWGTALFFARFILPPTWMPLLWGAFLILLGIYLGAFKPYTEHEWRWMLGKWLGIIAMLAGIFFFLFGLSQLAGWQTLSSSGTGSVAAKSLETAPAWVVNDEEGAINQAATEGKPLMMDFYADWCAACVELDHKTYNQPEVLSRAERFICLKLDFTKQNDWSKEMTQKYQVKGMPTVIFFNASGQEQERFVGFKPAAEVADIMDRILIR